MHVAASSLHNVKRFDKRSTRQVKQPKQALTENNLQLLNLRLPFSELFLHVL